MRQITRPPIRTQFIIFNLFGDYISPSGVAVWTSGLLRVLAVLDVSERAARSTLSRMKRKGWLEAQREGRRSKYRLTRRGKVLLDEGRQRLFGPRPREWDGRWHMVVYSLPQEKRALRHTLRTRLSWLGFGMLEPGVMVAAYPRLEEVCELIDELGVGAFAHYFAGARLQAAEHSEIVARCWDIPALNQRYGAFIQRHRPSYEQLSDEFGRTGWLAPDVGFMHRFWLTYEFSAFPRQDPYLPPQLLPAEWQGNLAADLLREYRALLRQPAWAYISQTLNLDPVEDAMPEDMVAMPGI
jgi:phenylacetic acid degradation operon negative regulatory protein